MLVEWGGFPWVVGGGVGVLLGLLMDRFSGWFDGRYPITKSGRAKKLAPEAASLGDLGRASESNKLPAIDFGQMATRCLLLVRKLQAIGVVFPQDSLTDETADLKFLSHQLRCVAPALSEGDIATANAVIISTMKAKTSKEDRLDALPK
ncbi:hypothetical protein JQW20_19165 [Sulfitobacter pseudonitzschiae]|nr:hypothetical protein [Pseudosulfitobacter pseudonitzschiae]